MGQLGPGYASKAASEDHAVFERRVRALPEVRQHRVCRIAEQHHAVFRTVFERVTQEEAPLAERRGVLEHRLHFFVPARKIREALRVRAFRRPRFDVPVVAVHLPDHVDELAPSYPVARHMGFRPDPVRAHHGAGVRARYASERGRATQPGR